MTPLAYMMPSTSDLAGYGLPACEGSTIFKLKNQVSKTFSLRREKLEDEEGPESQRSQEARKPRQKSKKLVVQKIKRPRSQKVRKPRSQKAPKPAKCQDSSSQSSSSKQNVKTLHARARVRGEI